MLVIYYKRERGEEMFYLCWGLKSYEKKFLIFFMFENFFIKVLKECIGLFCKRYNNICLIMFGECWMYESKLWWIGIINFLI